ncbi:beta-1 adrenergic receptor-like [Montipora capricornis]|uniref:beta-1 adrenergic receptor-like n=1 Tax=Montipora capricornis TaxID=246305 RepID=UPI0035F1D08C
MVPLITFLYVFLSSLITLGNVSVMLAVISTPTLRKATNFSLVSLAAADLFVGIVVLPLRILEAWTAFYWSRTTSWCKFSLGLTLLSLSASVLNLLIVTAERYFAIILPLVYHRKMTARRIFWALIFVWIVAILLSFSPFLGLKSSIVQERNHQHKICRFADTMSAEYLTTFACITVLMPTLFISFAYVRMYRAASKLKRRLKSLQVQPSRGQEITSALKESKSAKTIGIVVGVFYLCWIPFMIAVVLSAFFKDLVTPVVVLVISTLVFSNSAMNPVLYGYLNRDFRSAYKKLLSKAPCPYRIAFTHQERSYDLSDLSSQRKSFSFSVRSRNMDG